MFSSFPFSFVDVPRDCFLELLQLTTHGDSVSLRLKIGLHLSLRRRACIFPGLQLEKRAVKGPARKREKQIRPPGAHTHELQFDRFEFVPGPSVRDVKEQRRMR